MKTRIIKSVVTVLTVTLFICLSFISSAQVNSDSDASLNEKERCIKNLLNAGMPLNEINDLQENELYACGNGKLVSYSQKYVRVMCKRKEKDIYNDNIQSPKKVMVPEEDTSVTQEIPKKQWENEVDQVKKSQEGYIRVSPDITDNSKLTSDSKSSTSSVISNVSSLINKKNHGITLLTNDSGYTSGYSDWYDDGYLYYSLAVYWQYGSKYYILGSFWWEVPPTQREIDAFGVAHDSQMSRDTSSEPTCVFQYDIEYWPYGNYESTETVTNNESPCKDSGGVAESFKLFFTDDFTPYYYTNQRGHISYYTNLISGDVNWPYVNELYQHQESSTQVTPSISVPFSVGVSINNYPEKFVKLLPNLDLSVHTNYYK